ncbi:hypothetical protein SAMN05421688_2395 [Poseidonocella pacifica]|uniref:Uncharacterized protein n=1 Tax=Poseidonocella pacifica TaxID=871651 RepID=A0A1I0XMR6_9RHOB|nr:DUF5665 domain-containing protein [Poseidonocella pacifica]SFB01590.1 hypothetical protein SAMN05421688_2395 [Poseidonocella pacifica]
MTDRLPDTESIEGLRRELARMNNHRFIRIHNSAYRLMWFQFLRGLAFGLGSVLGASILVSILTLILSQFEFVPVVGEWAAQVVEEIRRELPDLDQ